MKNGDPLEKLKKLRTAIDGLITVMEKEEPSEEETEQAMGKFVMTLMELDAFK